MTNLCGQELLETCIIPSHNEEVGVIGVNWFVVREAPTRSAGCDESLRASPLRAYWARGAP